MTASDNKEIKKINLEEATLLSVLQKYKDEYNSNPRQMLKKIPAKEMWRFHIDGDKQKNDPEVTKEVKAWNFNDEDLLLFFPDFSKEYVKDNEDKEKADKELGLLKKQLVQDEKDLAIPLGELIKRQTGWIPFETRETGYLMAMMDAFVNIVLTTEDAITLDFINKLHLYATRNVIGTEYDETQSQKGQFREDKEVQISIDSTNTSEAGIRELLEKIISGHSHLKIEFYKTIDEPFDEITASNIGSKKQEALEKIMLHLKDPKVRVYLNSVVTPLHQDQSSSVKNVLAQFMQAFIQQYKDDIGKTTNPLEKIRIIVKFIRDCEQLHPYTDANCRTFWLLLNYLLMQNGFPPVLLDNPNRFDAVDLDTLVRDVIQGMQNTFRLLAENKIFDVSTDEILAKLSASQKEYFTHVIEIYKKSFLVAEEKTKRKRSRIDASDQQDEEDELNRNEQKKESGAPQTLFQPKKAESGAGTYVNPSNTSTSSTSINNNDKKSVK